MTMITEKGHVTIFSICVWDYNELKKLSGPRKDKQIINEVFVNNKELALYKKSQLINIINPTLAEFQNILNQYATARTAPGDVLVIFFSGHGGWTGNDFAFCFKDTITIDEKILPTSALPFSHLAQTLSNLNINPVIIIDACFAGRAAKKLLKQDVLTESLKSGLDNTGLPYFLLCASPDEDYALENIDGGYLTNAIYEYVKSGDKREKKSPSITLHNVFSNISTIMGKQTNASPRFFFKEKIEFVLCKNIKFKIREERFSPYQLRILYSLWDNGNVKKLTYKEIKKLGDGGAQGNHSKLDYIWGLTKVDKKTKSISITKKGINFLTGKIKIHRKMIFQDEKWIPKPGTNSESIDSFKQ